MVTYRVLIYRVSIEWSHIECSHRVVTHTLHFVFLFSHCLGSLAGIIDTLYTHCMSLCVCLKFIYVLGFEYLATF